MGIRHRFLYVGYVGRVFDDLEGLATAASADRRIGRLQPDATAILGDAGELRLQRLPPFQILPEGAIGLAVSLFRRHEHRVVLACDLAARIADRLQKDLVGVQYSPVEVEFDDRLPASNGCSFRGRLRAGL
ncbi:MULTISPECIES: hypothetical protein [unclassified Bosea (in: a-proteobacteria)]|uniref:hypothetical protein n=1 Tax=unclassified Bosea (in: a-proteobacteria) TaxID=2653178 RepID=UPI001FD2557D|nr:MULTISPECIES: hypothetical protein [unclassified Bosea (in: a-proteobacteria)]